MWRWAFAIALVGCGGDDSDDPDLDGDGIPDVADECQAGSADDAIDADGDGQPASADACPHDPAQAAADADGDGVPDDCDPFPVAATPDTQQCVTAFASTPVTAGYLAARPGETPWNLGGPLTATSAETVSVVSQIDRLYVSATYDVIGTIDFARADDTASFTLWLRAVNAPSSADTACGFDGTNNLFVLAANARNAMRPLPAPAAGRFRLRATVQDGNFNTVLCRLTIGGSSTTTVFNSTLQRGTFGFAATGANVTIDSVVTYSNDSRHTI